VGQKINQTLFRLGKLNNDWNFKYINKSKEESSLTSYNNLKIKKYINQLFFIYGLLIHNYKLNYSNSEINILISYFITKKTIDYIVNDKKKKHKLKLEKHKNPTFLFNKKFSNFLIKKRIKIIKKYKYFITKNKRIKIVNKFNFFINNLIESLKLYTNNKILKIKIDFQILNKNFSLRLDNENSKQFRNIIMQLKNFNKMYFFKETLNILLIIIKKKILQKSYQNI